MYLTKYIVAQQIGEIMYPKWIQHKQDIGQILVTSEAEEKEVRALWKKRDAEEAKRAEEEAKAAADQPAAE